MIGNILQAAVQNRSSDIHFSVGMPPLLRMSEGMLPLQVEPMTAQDMAILVGVLVRNLDAPPPVDTIKDLDGSFEIPNLARFRFNVFRKQKNLGAVLRVIPMQVPTLEDLGLPPVLKQIARYPRGLILVTGATGSGKSSTLAAMIREINFTERSHIVTIEDPIEYVHQSQLSCVSQREVGPDTDSFAKALKSALRQDPDVILVGEMRDIETLDVALKAAETGHVVFSTVHTTDAIKTIGRLVALYPADEQNMVRMRLADNLKATISQRLVPRIDTSGKIVAMEIMIVNHGVQECIANPRKTGEINNFIEAGRERLGCMTFDQHLGELYSAGIVSLDVAKDTATNAADFERNIMFGENQSNSPSPIEGTQAVEVEEREPEPEPEPEPEAAESANDGENSDIIHDAASFMREEMERTMTSLNNTGEKSQEEIANEHYQESLRRAGKKAS